MLVLADLDESRAWRLRFEAKFDRMNRTMNMGLGVIVFLGVLAPIVFGLISRR